MKTFYYLIVSISISGAALYAAAQQKTLAEVVAEAVSQKRVQSEETAIERIYKIMSPGGGIILQCVCSKNTADPKKCDSYSIRNTCTALPNGSCSVALTWGTKKISCKAENGNSCTSYIGLTADEWKQLTLPL